MRRVQIQVPRGEAPHVLRLATEHDAVNGVHWPGEGPDGPCDVVAVAVANARLGPLLSDLGTLDDVHIDLHPIGAVPLQPPERQLAQQVGDVTLRSPMEVLLDGLQSVGSWRGFLAYAALAAVVGWTGLFTGGVYLLTASMLLAPFAGPAMNAALATASGNPSLLGSSLLRYVVALTTTVGVGAGLSLVFGQDVATPLMVGVSSISGLTVLLPLAAGASGATFLVQAERDSLVSGAAVGMLVAASLAPPAVVTGMALALGKWPMAGSTAFVLVLQLFGIHLSGALVFRLAGVTADLPRLPRGRAWMHPLGLAVSAAVVLALVVFQHLHDPVALERSSLARRALAPVREAVQSVPRVHPVDIDATFTRSDVPGQDTLLVQVVVQRDAQAPAAPEVEAQVQQAITDALLERFDAPTPLVQVTALTPPPSRTGR